MTRLKILILLQSLSLFAKDNHPKAFILDMDGVLRRGFMAIKGAQEFIKWSQDKKIPTVILTNECRYSEERLRGDLQKMGVSIPLSIKIYTAAMAMRDFFKEKIPLKDSIYCYVLGEEGLKKAMQEVNNPNLILTDTIPDGVKNNNQLYLVLGSVEQVSMHNLHRASKWVKSGAKVLLSSTDSSHPSSKGEKLIAMPGHILHMLKKNYPLSSYNTGKPNPLMLQKILKILRNKISNLKNKDIMFVGDSLDTDIKIAFEHNITSSLVLSGNTTKQMCRNSIIQPDFIFPTIKELHDYFKTRQVNKTISLW
jgi:HAD superfamily hydrolase (TIGR01450 family)